MRHYEPREYQRLATNFLLNTHRAGLWAQPGLGKTATVYAMLDILKLVGSSFFPALVIAPKRVCELVWPAEQQKWDAFADLRVVTILGEADLRDKALMLRGDVYVINYENVQWLVSRLGCRWPFRIVICDESTRLKNFRLHKGSAGKRSQALSEIAMQVGRWINLTGTPAPNGLKDLWGQTWFLDYGARLGRTYSAYMDRWFYTDPYSREVKAFAHSSGQIYAALTDVTLALRTEDWFNIMKPLRFTREVELPPEARRTYRQMERDLFCEFPGAAIAAPTAAVQSMKLLQMASSGIYDGDRQWHHIHDAKIEALRSLVEELAGEPLLVAYWFRGELELLKKAFPEFRVFSGKTDETAWNEGRVPLMGVHPASAGHGINLQYGGRALAFFTQTWDLELREQVIERIGPVRQAQAGLNRAVLLYDLCARATLDEEVLERLESKRSVQEALMLAQAHRGGAA